MYRLLLLLAIIGLATATPITYTVNNGIPGLQLQSRTLGLAKYHGSDS
jgi:hypothetical protein